MVGSASAIAGTLKVRFFVLPRTNGTLFSEAYETENLTVSAGSELLIVAKRRVAAESGGPSSFHHLSRLSVSSESSRGDSWSSARPA